MPTVRAEARAPGHMVASSHPAVSELGAQVLAAGGTAGDAALAMGAMSFVALPGQCGLGGDAFAVWYEAATGHYGAVQGSGVGPDGADAGFFAGHGLDALPIEGPLSASVPGEMAAVATLHRHLATRPLSELWAPAAEAARRGLPVTAATHEDLETYAGKLTSAAARRVLLPDGRIPAVGSPLRQTELATTIERVAASPEDFYEGDLATRCLRALTDAGAPFSGREWRQTAAPATETVTGTYRGLVVHENPPPSPGYMVLWQAAVLDGVLAELPWLSGRALAWLAGAAAMAFADRRRMVGSGSDEWRDLLAPDAVAGARAALSADRLPPVEGSMRSGDTTSVVAVDAAGNAVSFIHSLAFTFGSGFMVPGTGVMLNDRLGRGAYLDAGHPNGVLPGRRPMHTLNAWIVAGPTGRPAFVGNTPGGDGQVQWNMQLLTALVDHGVGPQAAVEAPRMTVFPGSDADTVGSPPEVRCESRLGGPAIDELRGAGVPIVVQGPWAGGGSAQVIALDPATGERRGGSDPRFDGLATGG
ncbi:MAG: gamma-glutamyltransferase [Acidimicrobiales bacterium]